MRIVDPTDDCDPNNGGADCIGICIGGTPPVTCGSVTCPSGQVCCNASCGICTPPGFGCIQIACLPAS